MRHFAPLALCSLMLLSACGTDDNAEPRPHPLQGGMVGQEFGFKVKAEEWQPHGTPGSDTHGFAVMKDVYLLSPGVEQHNVVQLFVRRDLNNWVLLPMQAHEGAPEDVNWRYVCGTNKIQVAIDRSGEAFSAPGHLLTFKVVVFPR